MDNMNMTEQEMENVLRKIESLFALSANNPSKEEAQRALLKAQELMLKYNIEHDFTKEHNPDEVIVVEYDFGRQQMLQVYTSIALLVADNFRTKTYRGSKTIYFMGIEADAKASLECFKFLIDMLKNGFKRFLEVDKQKNIMYTIGGASYTKATKKDWYAGFVVGLRKAFKERVEADKRYELMVVTPALVKKEYDTFLSNSNVVSRRVSVNSSGSNDNAYRDGHLTGESALKQNKRLVG